jgi:hypothetical protein
MEAQRRNHLHKPEENDTRAEKRRNQGDQSKNEWRYMSDETRHLTPPLSIH